jgi:hypothetical protein
MAERQSAELQAGHDNSYGAEIAMLSDASPTNVQAAEGNGFVPMDEPAYSSRNARVKLSVIGSRK